MKLFKWKRKEEGLIIGIEAFFTWVNHRDPFKSIHIRWPFIRSTREIVDTWNFRESERLCVLVWSFRYFGPAKFKHHRKQFQIWWKPIDEFDDKKYRRQQVALKRQGLNYDRQVV